MHNSPSNFPIADQTLKVFGQLTRRYALFHAAFILAFVFELLGLLIFMPFLAQTIGFAALIALALLTLFTYFVLRFYFQSKKPEQLMALQERFLAEVKRQVAPKEGSWSMEGLYPIYHLLHLLQGQESHYYPLPSFLQTLAPVVNKFSVWCHWEDVQWMKEALHAHALDTLFTWVKAFPTDVKLHRVLAEAYIAFYDTYRLPVTASPLDTYLISQYQSAAMRQKFEQAARFALEELKVILHYAHQDMWALHQLAKVQHDLDLKQEERKTYEAILHLMPQNREIQYKLGKLYFELGHMAQGLHLYHEMQARKDPDAQQLIEHYDAYHRSFLT